MEAGGAPAGLSPAEYRELERGNLAFVVRPRVELPGVQRFYLLLSPEGHPVHRRIAIGKKHLPRPRMRDREWAYVEHTCESPSELLSGLGPKTYATKSKGLRYQPHARVVAEASYHIVAHGEHTHLDYMLEEDYENDHASGLLRSLAIEPRGSLIVAVFNPLAPRNRATPRDRQEGADADRSFREPSIFPDELQDTFEERRFGALAPDFLDYEGAELVLMNGRPEPHDVPRSPDEMPTRGRPDGQLR